MYNEVIKLINETRSVNGYGDIQLITTERIVFAELKSISQSEFYQANAAGLKPEVKFVIADFLDYGGEERILYKPYNGVEQEYKVLRTYRDGKRMELVCYRGVDK